MGKQLVPLRLWWKKYETEGDLGTVAQTCKSKQRTLDGFFTVTQSKSVNGSITNSKKKGQYLTAADVLHTLLRQRGFKHRN